jgi:hypothetical protein
MVAAMFPARALDHDPIMLSVDHFRSFVHQNQIATPINTERNSTQSATHIH